jgi:hypothetical protein
VLQCLLNFNTQTKHALNISVVSISLQIHSAHGPWFLRSYLSWSWRAPLVPAVVYSDVWISGHHGRHCEWFEYESTVAHVVPIYTTVRFQIRGCFGFTRYNAFLMYL